EASNALTTRLEQAKRALDQTPEAEAKWKDAVRDLEKRNREVLRTLRGDVALRSRNENVPPSIAERVGGIVDATRFALTRPTGTQREQYGIAGEELATELAKLRQLFEDLKPLEKALDLAGAPWTPGRLPEWKGK